MIKSFKYRLYPTGKQIKALTYQLEGHRFLYNLALAQRKEVFEQTGKGLNYFDQARELTKIRKDDICLSSCNYSSLQQTFRRLDKAFKSFFRRVKAGEKPGYPRFKSADRFNTISYATIGDGCQIKDGKVYLQNVGHVKVKWHREIDGKVKTLSITRRNDRWYVSFFVECEPIILPKTGKEVGIDMGLNFFATLSDGLKIEAPKFLRKYEKLLKKAHRRLSRRKKGSNRRKKARKILARIHEKIANQRLDFCHKVSHSLVKNYDGFAVEALNIEGMVKNRYLAKSINDASWGMFLNILKYKAENAGRWYQEVTPNGTSQNCSTCGMVVEKSLATRVHNCPNCGLSLDRDINAAINILKAGMQPSWRGGNIIPLIEARS